MHRHEHDALERDVAAPRARTEDERPPQLLVQAAVAGRPDVLGPSGLLRLQRMVGNGGVRDLAEAAEPISSGTSGGGSPLDERTRADMEVRFGTDFSDVRVHTGESAHASAASVGAHAYTTGSNIVFQRGNYEPGSATGRTMLAHELTHVVQQRGGPVDGTPTGRGYQVSDPSDRFEQEATATAERIVTMPTSAPVGLPAAASVAAASMQRDAAEEEEEPVQGCFEPGATAARDETVQREGDQDDELG